MCIAIVKPRAATFPTEEIFKECFDSNNDGAGFAVATGKVVHIRKGLMTIEDFLEAFKDERSKYEEPEKLGWFFHFRIGTHGSKDSPIHTHPFPITPDYDPMYELDIEAPLVGMHNGVLSFTGGSDSSSSYSYLDKEWDSESRSYKKKADAKPQPSDSQEYFAKIIHPLSQLNPKWMTAEAAHNLIDSTAGSNRLAFMNAQGGWLIHGNFIEHEGCHYSNETFRPRVVATSPAVVATYLSNEEKKDKIIAGYMRKMLGEYLKNPDASLFETPETIDLTNFPKMCEEAKLEPLVPAGWNRAYGMYLEYPNIGLAQVDTAEPRYVYFPEDEQWAVRRDEKYPLFGILYQWDSKYEGFDFSGVVKLTGFSKGEIRTSAKYTKPYYATTEFKPAQDMLGVKGTEDSTQTT